MSSDVREPSNETLRELVARTWSWNPEATVRLRKQAKSHEDFVCLAKYDAAERQVAIRKLIELRQSIEEDKWVDLWDDLWARISDKETMFEIGTLILESPSGFAKFSFGHIATYVEPLRDKAIEGIVREGAYFVEELNALWRWGAEQYRDGVWERYHQNWVGKEMDYHTHRRLFDLMNRGYGDLGNRAWQAFLKMPTPRPGADCLTELAKFLRHPYFCDEVKDYIAHMPHDKDKLHRHLMFEYPERLGWTIDRWLCFHPAPGGLIEIIQWSPQLDETKEQLAPIKAVAACRALSRADLTEQHLLTLAQRHGPSIAEANDRLMSGQFVNE